MPGVIRTRFNVAMELIRSSDDETLDKYDAWLRYPIIQLNDSKKTFTLPWNNETRALI